MKVRPRGFPVLEHERSFTLRLSNSVKEVCRIYPMKVRPRSFPVLEHERSFALSLSISVK